MPRILFALALLAVVARGQGWPLPPAATGNLYVSGFSSDNVGEFAPDGTLLRTFSHPTMTNPRGLGVEDDGDIAVVVQTNSRVLVFDPDGTYRRTVTHPDLNDGTGLSRSPTGNWYVGNFNPGRVVVFDSTWNYLTTITAPGMSGVNCVSFDSSGSGEFAVTSATTNLVYRFGTNHQPIGIVSHPHIGSPMSVADDAMGNHFLSNGTSHWVLKFDPSWNYITSFGQGIVLAPQGIAVGEDGNLTISSFATPTVYRFDPQGNLLGSFPLTSVVTGRNMAYQTSSRILARHGNVGRGTSSTAEDVLLVSGQAGDGARRVHLGANAPFSLAVASPSAGPAFAPYAIYAVAGEPALGDVYTMPFGLGQTCFAPAFANAVAVTIANNTGAAVLGAPLLPSVAAPSNIFTLPAGIGVAATITFQGLIIDNGSQLAPAVPLSVTNAVTAVIL